MKKRNRRVVKLALIQVGPATEDKQKNPVNILNLIDKAAKKEPDFIILPELCTVPYFCTAQDPKYLEWAEPVSGPTIRFIAKKAKEYKSCILVPLLRKGNREAEYYNSAVVIGGDGKVVYGKLSGAKRTVCYDKVHLPKVETAQISLDEKV